MNLREIKELIRIIDNSSLTEFQYEKDDYKIFIKKEGKVLKNKYTESVEKEETSGEALFTEVEEPAKQMEKEDENLFVVVSPIVGTFYSAPGPEAPAYVKIGDRVKKGDVLCIVEAMKLMNEINSDVDGEIVEILAENQSIVEYGQPLFKIRKV
ncbi:acetyl-CoA carboxylase [Fervidicella metallireducens AeB]|uniref:Biotin carboxyl carrier protein of acetyl-CoA carboxylase n=1 Tax=Fervidicella metallireducens AeB TaxID=1403537 RepID=A0A017RX02_9CLOT|nr:acetyl-CoA carboxylase biotin carboxyl carrier protein [Fervidicella metallireducens]EYE88929.1 acetyl-CoA carboxylase [Fervidicella metallireducens AeB]